MVLFPQNCDADFGWMTAVCKTNSQYLRMGCVNCSMPLPPPKPPQRPCRTATHIDSLIEETTRKSLRIKKANYIKIKEGSLSEYYDIGEKIGEGER